MTEKKGTKDYKQIDNSDLKVEWERYRLQAVLEALPIGVFIADASQEIIQTNQLVDQIWGGKAPLAKDITQYQEYKGWWTDSKRPIRAEEWALARALTQGETSKGEVIDILRFDGTKGTILNSAAPIKDANGQITGAVVTIQDITDRRAIYSLLRLGLEDLSTDVFLQKALEIIIAISFLETKGCIFLVDEKEEVLDRKAEKNLDQWVKENCKRVFFGHCLCGQAAHTKKLEFIDGINKKHESCHKNRAEHGHYCIPILTGSNQLLGILNLYVKKGHRSSQMERDFLNAVASTLAGGLARKKAEEEVKKHRDHLGKLVKERTSQLEKINLQLKQEIFERKKVKEELDHFFNLSRDMLAIASLENCKFLWLNPAFERILGYSREELLAQPFIYFIHPEDRDATIEEIKKLKNDEHVSYFENRYRCQDGTYKWLSWSSTPVIEDSLIYAVARDITVQKQMLEEISQLASIVECSNDAIIGKTLEGIITSWNKGAESIFGYTALEVIGQPITLLFPPDLRNEAELILALIKQGENINSFETKRINRTGALIDVSVTVSPIKNSNGEIIGASTIIRDITEAKRVERELGRLDRLNLIGEMAAGISHEIRNPLTTVRGFLQILGVKEECAKYKEYFDLMIDELDRANVIITEFLAIGKNTPVKLEKQNLNKIIKAISPLIQADAMGYNIYLETELGDIPSLLLDEKEIRQVILNLARNGLEAMAQGGRLIIKTYTEEEEVILVVKDNGKGIEPEVLEKLGTPFFTTKDNGTGLGLAICYSIVEKHNAVIDVKTDKSGTTFYIRFPIAN